MTPSNAVCFGIWCVFASLVLRSRCSKRRGKVARENGKRLRGEQTSRESLCEDGFEDHWQLIGRNCLPVCILGRPGDGGAPCTEAFPIGRSIQRPGARQREVGGRILWRRCSLVSAQHSVSRYRRRGDSADLLLPLEALSLARAPNRTPRYHRHRVS